MRAPVWVLKVVRYPVLLVLFYCDDLSFKAFDDFINLCVLLFCSTCVESVTSIALQCRLYQDETHLAISKLYTITQVQLLDAFT